MYDPFRNYDQWLTTDRSLDWEPPPPLRCSCGAFVKRQPVRSEYKEDILHCDGTVKEYFVEHSDGMNDILGTEPGSGYTMTASHCGVDTKPHAPHDDVMNAWVENHHLCTKCGADFVMVDA